MGIKGESIFELIMGNSGNEYSQLDPTVDTRTFLYYEVFQDLKSNEAFLFGKGLNAGYYSASFVTYNRPIVEVGFLQIILKMGIVGFLLYVIVILRALFRALNDQKVLS
jgi:O-antigen ligase